MGGLMAKKTEPNKAARPRIFVTQPVSEQALKRLRAVARVAVYADSRRIIPTFCSVCCMTRSTERWSKPIQIFA
jgi:hypothetical protein